jgi:hypothetical protein
MRSTSIRCRNRWQLNPQIFHLTSFGNCLNERGQLWLTMEFPKTNGIRQISQLSIFLLSNFLF